MTTISVKTNPEMPAAIIGNSRMLASLRSNGEIYRLFWPYIEYGQHLGHFWPGLRITTKVEESFTRWFHLNCWDTAQHYLEHTNIFETAFSSASHAIKVTQRDFVLPDRDVLVRFYELKNEGNNPEKISFWLYCNFNIEESQLYDSGYFEPSNNSLVFYRRDIYLAVAGTGHPLTGYHLGRRGTDSDPYQAASHGTLYGNKDNIRDSAGSLSWDLGALAPGQTQTFSLYLAAGNSKEDVWQSLAETTCKSGPELLNETADYWRNWLKPATSEDSAGQATYIRSLLAVKLMCSKETGASIAAPEFDPYYLACGGYGYCWPRDAVYVAAAMDEAGYHDVAGQFYQFASSVQEQDGSWHQRYFTNGNIATTWGQQIDQTGSVLWGYRHHYNLTHDRAFLEQIWPSLTSGAMYLAENLAENGLPSPSYDIWEDFNGQATYSAAAVYAGLHAAAELARIKKCLKEKELWQQGANRVRAGILQHLWSPRYNRFRRGINRKSDRGAFEDARRRNEPAFIGKDVTGLYETYWVGEDNRADTALLGLAFPFAVISPLDRRMEATASSLEELLWNHRVGGLHRYEWDGYRNGNPWVLTTLWLCIYHCMAGNLERAGALYKWACEHTNRHRLMPEQIDKSNGLPVWVLPLSWSHAMFIMAHLALQGNLSIIKS
ncbi:MAG: glycoside hydrolase family 15 protein [Pelotomaculum sp.]